MRTFSAASAPWIEGETDFHEIEQIRGTLLSAWREVDAQMESQLTGNGSSETVISDLFDAGRILLLLSAQRGDVDTSSLLSGALQDLLSLKKDTHAR